MRPAVEQQDAAAQAADGRHVVAHEQNRPAVAGGIAHLPEALLLERRVTDGEHLVDDQDLGLEMGGDAEASRSSCHSNNA
jgi:hypothetical protein